MNIYNFITFMYISARYGEKQQCLTKQCYSLSCDYEY